jgi:hypothetical protein
LDGWTEEARRVWAGGFCIWGPEWTGCCRVGGRKAEHLLHLRPCVSFDPHWFILQTGLPV